MATSYTLEPTELGDVAELVVGLREADRRELVAATGREPQAVILEGLSISQEAWTVRFDGELAYVGGVVPVQDGIGLGWLLSTNLVERKPKLFWRSCKELLPWVASRWQSLRNAMDVRHEKALRWGRHLGFRFLPEQPVVEGGDLFAPFIVTEEYLRCALQQ